MTPTPSPCISVCKINAQTGLCEGCWRTLEEIANWGTASETVKQEIWEQIHQRIQHTPPPQDLNNSINRTILRKP